MFESTPRPEEAVPGPGIREKIGTVLSAAVDAFSTRLEIFSEEAGEKAVHLGRGLASLAGALFAASVVFFLFAALLVALFTLLFGGRLWAGILATLLLYGGLTAWAVIYGVKALSRVQPLSFPVTGAELRKDMASLTVPEADVDMDADETGAPVVGASGGPGRRTREPSTVDDFEARFRAGSE